MVRGTGCAERGSASLSVLAMTPVLKKLVAIKVRKRLRDFIFSPIQFDVKALLASMALR